MILDKNKFSLKYLFFLINFSMPCINYFKWVIIGIHSCNVFACFSSGNESLVSNSYGGNHWLQGEGELRVEN